MLLWSVDMNHFKGVHGGRETAQFAEFAVRNIPLHPLDTHTHTITHRLGYPSPNQVHERL